MAAALIPMIAGKAKNSGGDLVSKALTNDLAVLRGTTKPRGKGKKKKGGGLEYEIHVNPAGVGMGAVAIGGAVLVGATALWLSGMSVGRQTGQYKVVSVRNVGTKDERNWKVYNSQGVPIKTLGKEFIPEDILSPTQSGKGWSVAPDSITKVNDSLYTIGLINKDKNHFQIGQRPRFSIFGSDTSGGGITIYDVLTSPYWWTKYVPKL
jgi:hypothetical protein